jgi:putative holliday junction resolvase
VTVTGREENQYLASAVTGIVLAFDFGARRIGVAVGNTETRHAEPLSTIDACDSSRRFAAISALIADWEPSLLVVGLPLSVDGSEHEMTVRSRRFANQLRGRFGLPVATVDERFTSADADVRLRDAGANWKQRKKRVDAVAAELILRDYLDAHT